MTGDTDQGWSENRSPAIIDASSTTHTPPSGDSCRPWQRRTVWKLGSDMAPPIRPRPPPRIAPLG